MASRNQKPFGLSSCRDMRDKLERELKRLASATDRDELVDHGINAAFTGWHLVEWTWADIKHRPDLRARLAREAGLSANGLSFEVFTSFVVTSCPDLAYCRIVTNNAKHLGSDSKPGDPSFSTDVAPAEVAWTNARGEPVTWTNSKGEPVTWTTDAWDLLIIDDGGSKRRAVEVYERALSWWTTFIYGYEIDGRQEPLSETAR